VKRTARIGDKRRNTWRGKRTRSRYESIVKVVVKKDFKKMDWIYLAQDKHQWWSVVNTVLCPHVP
jgi:hypothetical protein